jgi:hypothetical protein
MPMPLISSVAANLCRHAVLLLLVLFIELRHRTHKNSHAIVSPSHSNWKALLKIPTLPPTARI